MLRLDLGALPDRWPGMLALGVSLGLHGAALTGLLLFQDATPPKPYAVIAVEVVQAVDVVRTPGGDPVQEPHSSQVTQEESLAITENMVDPERLADMGAQDERPAASEAPNTSDRPPVEPVEEPTRVSAHGPMPENAPTQHDAVPEALRDPSRAAETPFGPEDPIEATRPVPPPPRRKPLALDRLADSKPAESRIEKQQADMKGAPPRPIDQGAAQEITQSDVETASARTRPAATLNVRKSGPVAALPATGPNSGLIGDFGDSPGSLPKYSGGGISNPAPRYPYLSRRRGQEGRVVLLVHVTAGGDAAAVRLRQSSGYRLLDEAAVEAIKKWRFIPATRAGTPVAGSVDVPVSFKLTD